MKQLEKLDTLIIEDNLDLSTIEISKRAQDVASEKSQMFGWRSIELRPTNLTGTPAPGHRRFQFDIYGIAGEGAEVAPSSNSPKQNQAPGTAASPQAEV